MSEGTNTDDMQMVVISLENTTVENIEQGLQQVQQLEQLIFAHSAWSEQQVLSTYQSMSGHILLLAKANCSQPLSTIGYVIYSSLFDQAELLRVGVHPNYTRQGYAEAMICQLFKTLQQQDVQALILEVGTDNSPAIALYKKLGFRQIDIRKDYYQRDATKYTDAYIFQKVIQTNSR